ncbi:MAG TPA: fumarate reductase subunit FrdD [Candidatus Limnocylindrales bacterium]|nr:fumarate reductase subunit FrdD [Candidatus Limnocylindrales bacterium]
MDPQPTKLRIEPLLWILFSAGGVVAAFLVPIQLFFLGIATPLRMFQAAEYTTAIDIVRLPLVRLYLFVLCSVPLFHAAHRIRYTLYDGLQIKHLNEVIAVACYGGAVIGTLIAGSLLWNFH